MDSILCGTEFQINGALTKKEYQYVLIVPVVEQYKEMLPCAGART